MQDRARVYPSRRSDSFYFLFVSSYSVSLPWNPCTGTGDDSSFFRRTALRKLKARLYNVCRDEVLLLLSSLHAHKQRSGAEEMIPVSDTRVVLVVVVVLSCTLGNPLGAVVSRL